MTFAGEFTQTADLAILPRGPRPGAIPMLIGSVGERMLRLTLPHVEYWNMWWADFGNTVDGLAPFLERVDRIAVEVGRDPADIRKTVAVLVTAPGGQGRAQGNQDESAIKAISGSPREVGMALRALGEVGIDHLQVVLDPITPESIRWLANSLDTIHA